MTAAIQAPKGLRRDAPLARLTSLKVGGSADLLLTAGTSDELLDGMAWLWREGLACRWIGGGSNLLVCDAGVEAAVGRYTGAQFTVRETPCAEVDCEAGHSLPRLARTLARQGWAGLEWAANVPGTLGGAIVNNAGAFGSSISEHLIWAELLTPDRRLERLSAAELDYGYRSSRLKRGELPGTVVVRGVLRLHRAAVEQTTARVAAFQRQRTLSQPRLLSAGSVFANPEGDYAGRLIEAAGLKGRRIGGAEISTQHANFIVNPGGATARDVYDLMRLAQESVWASAGVWLQAEIELLGRWSPDERQALLAPTSRAAPA